MKRLVLLGGGHAHLHVLADFATRPVEGVSLTLVTPFPRLHYTGMLPGCIAGHYGAEEIAIDLVALAGRAQATLIQSAAILVNPARREIICGDTVAVGYDALSFDIGSQSMRSNVGGVERFAVPVRPLENLLAGWERVRSEARGGALRSVSVVGGGAGGVELALAMDWRLKSELGGDAPHVRIITDTPVPLPDFTPGVRRRLLAKVLGRGIGSHTGCPVREVGEGFVRLANGLEFTSEATFWAAGAGAPEIFRNSGLATDARGFLSIDEHFHSKSHPGVFGVGDCATNERDPRPKAGVFAVRAGPALAANLRATLAGAPLAPWSTPRRYLALISTGDRCAVGSWGPVSWEGAWAWRWKDRIDRAFVARYKK